MNYSIIPRITTRIRPFGRVQYFREGRMPSIASKTLKFKPPAAAPRNADIRGYRLRVAPDGGPGSASKYSLAFVDLGNPPQDAQGFVTVDLAGLPSLAALDGTFDLAVTAYDDAVPPNESDFLAVENANVDFVAPAAPTDGSVN